MIVEALVEAIGNSDVAAVKAMEQTIRSHNDPWLLHLSLYPAVQRVLNPPFINPHLPKMYDICRELVPYLSKEDIGSLVYLEVVEYARRPKLERPSSTPLPNSKIVFSDIEKSIAAGNREETANLLAGFREQQGGPELVRRLVLLGSGYLNESLGHSVSCTAFIIREVIERPDSDAALALFLLADYFCKGGFERTPALLRETPSPTLTDHILRSVTGSGFSDLHHTITLYAIETMKPFLTEEDLAHLIASWIKFLGEKRAEPRLFSSEATVEGYAEFRELFSRLDADVILDHTAGMLTSAERRNRLSRFLVTGVCDLYQGNYNPHYLTGLGSLLWFMRTYHHQPALAQNALYQYLDFYFRNMTAGG